MVEEGFHEEDVWFEACNACGCGVCTYMYIARLGYWCIGIGPCACVHWVEFLGVVMG